MPRAPGAGGDDVALPFATPGALGATPAPSSEASETAAGLQREELERQAAMADELDRAWYDADEGGATVDESVDPFSAAGYDDEPAQRGGPAVAAAPRLKRNDGTLMTAAQSARALAKRQDADAWEASRLAAAGAGPGGASEALSAAAADAEEAQRAVLVVKDPRPPFLAGAPLGGKAAAPVLPVKDPTSDLAVVARAGSALVRSMRLRRDAARGRARFWQVVGSAMAKVTGVTAEEAEEAEQLRREDLEREGEGEGDDGAQTLGRGVAKGADGGGQGGDAAQAAAASGGAPAGGAAPLFPPPRGSEDLSLPLKMGGDAKGAEGSTGEARVRETPPLVRDARGSDAEALARAGGGRGAGAAVGSSGHPAAAPPPDRTTLSVPSPDSPRTHRRKISEQRRRLPVALVRAELMSIIREHQIVIVVGETGSGKTTQMTQYLLEEGLCGLGAVGCTQPRRVAAVSVAERVADEMGVELGKEVGYSIRFEDCTSASTRIKYMTDGVLLRESLGDPDLERYGCIVMDEAHERSLNTDVLFGVLRGVAARRRDLRLVVTSATLDAERFAEFFGGAPVFRVPGRTFPVEVLHARAAQEDYVEAAVKQAVVLHVSQPPGDALVFLTGQEEVETACEAIAERVEALSDRAPPALVLPVYSQLPADLQRRIFEPAPDDARKIVVATNVAETSLTLDGVRYVVDSGFAKLKVYDGRAGMDVLAVFPESRAAADQRAGRAGRTAPGICFRLYTKHAYEREMLPANVPEIRRTSLAATALQLAGLGLDPSTFPFMDPPPAANLARSRLQLWSLGALDDAGRLTRRGSQMTALPLDPPLAALVLEAASFGVAADALTLVAMLSVPPVWFRPKDRASEADAARERFAVPESDHLTLVNVFGAWARAGRNAAWAASHFVQHRALRRAAEVRDQLKDLCRQQGILERLPRGAVGAGLRDPLDRFASSIQSPDGGDALRRCVARAFAAHASRLKGLGEYTACRSGVRCHLHSTSALFGLGLAPEYVVYHELVATVKEYMQVVSAVEPEWLVEGAPGFYELRTAGGGGACGGGGGGASGSAALAPAPALPLVARPLTAASSGAAPESARSTTVPARGRASPLAQSRRLNAASAMLDDDIWAEGGDDADAAAAGGALGASARSRSGASASSASAATPLRGRSILDDASRPPPTPGGRVEAILGRAAAARAASASTPLRGSATPLRGGSTPSRRDL